MLRDTSSERRAVVSENSLVANASKSEGEVSESQRCGIAHTGQATPQIDDCEIDPKLDGVIKYGHYFKTVSNDLCV